ncbi:MAG: hypothetical protein R3F54_14090 [Alphaproteobacteria bacterium]
MAAAEPSKSLGADITPEPIRLPPRAEGSHYVRPPKEDQNLVPDCVDGIGER